MSHLRSLPSVEALLKSRHAAELISESGRSLTLQAIRYVLEDIRKNAGEQSTVPDREAILARVRSQLDEWLAPTLLPVINATGVILHTNLGRAPLSRSAIKSINVTCSGYSTLEFDLVSGTRGSRTVHAERILCQLTGSEAALVVNNNAAGVLLVLSALARRKKVAISRTQLVEIGGGFRVPDVMRQSGAQLVEIGTTNRVHLSDYEAALDEGIRIVLRAHASNFRIIGFTSEPNYADVVELVHSRDGIMVDDLGSGALLETSVFGLAHEPMVQESIAAGADIVCFSGDKLLGGPQAGIILGKRGLIEKIKKHPLARAVRADKLCLAALNATLLHYLKDEAEREIPVWRCISQMQAQIEARAQYWVRSIGQGEVVPGQSTVGGGSLPGETLPTYVLRLYVRHPTQFMKKLRSNTPPIIARVEEDGILFDPRTVLPEQEGALLVALQNLLLHKTS